MRAGDLGRSPGTATLFNRAISCSMANGSVGRNSARGVTRSRWGKIRTMRHIWIKTNLLTLWLLTCVLPVSGGQESEIDSFPDFLQTDAGAALPRGGNMFCGPVAASNSLMWLRDRGYSRLAPNTGDARADQLAVIQELAEPPFMNTAAKDGTTPGPFLRGIRNFITAKGYQTRRLEYRGLESVRVAGVQTYEVPPDMSFMCSGRTGNACGWLHVQYGNFVGNLQEFQCVSAHWLTLVGFGEDSQRRRFLIVHDSSPRAGKGFAHNYLHLQAIKEATIVAKRYTHSAAGCCLITDGLALKHNTKDALVDGCVVLELQ